MATCAWCGRQINVSPDYVNVDGERFPVHPEHQKLFEGYHTPWDYRLNQQRIRDDTPITTALQYLLQHDQSGVGGKPKGDPKDNYVVERPLD